MRVAMCQDELSRKQTEQIVGTLLEDMLAGIKTPERPRSPVDAYITDEDIFRQRNPKVLRYQTSQRKGALFGFSSNCFSLI